MRVLHVIPSVSPKRGGPSAALPMLMRASAAASLEVSVATTDDDGPEGRVDVAFDEPLQRDDGATYFYFPRQLMFYTVSWPLRSWLRRHVREFDVVHVHALFSFPSVAAARAAADLGVPFVIRPLGVLNRWGMENRRRTVKRASFRRLELPLIRRAAAMHYTSEREKREAEAVDPLVAATRSAIIPLPIEQPNSSGATVDAFHGRFNEANGAHVVLFLSRIDRKKGIELLLQAFADVHREFPRAVLVIAGSGEEGYVRELHAQADRLNLGSRVLWPGFVTGADKEAAFAAATLFVLPSYSENFGIAAAEALAAGVPVLLSDQVAVADDVVDAEAGVVVRCEAGAIAAALRELLGDPELRAKVSLRGKALVEERYSLITVGAQLKNLYESVVNLPRQS